MAQGFQFSPISGVIPIQDADGFDATALQPATVNVQRPAASAEAIAPVSAPMARATSAPSPALKAAPPTTINPRAILKAARSRVKEIKSELRRMNALKQELGQLERMLAATKKPPASLTQITSRRAG